MQMIVQALSVSKLKQESEDKSLLMRQLTCIVLLLVDLRARDKGFAVTYYAKRE